MTILNHGTFSIYTPVVPDLPAEPAAPLLPVPPAPLPSDATAEQQVQHAAATAAYQSQAAVYETARQQHIGAHAAWQEACAPIRHLKELVEARAIFARREDGRDWYDLTRTMPDGRHYAIVIGGTVVSVSPDAQMFGIQNGMTLLESSTPVEIGWTWNGLDLIPPPDPTLLELKMSKIEKAWKEQEKRLDSYTIYVPINGVSQPFGCDSVSRENIMGLNALISQERGGLLPPGTVPNPREFTPKGQQMPVMVSHQEFAFIGAAMAAAKDSHFVTYATHKFVISSLTSLEEIEDYDITVGWPT